MHRRTIIGGLVATLALPGTPRTALGQDNPEILVVGTLHALSLTRRDSIPWLVREAGGDEDEIAIEVSNRCGIAQATFRVTRATADMPIEFTTELNIGEWCEPPIPFEQQSWLLVLDSRTQELLARFQVTPLPDDTLIAVQHGPALNRPLSAEVATQLTLSALPEPLELSLDWLRSEDEMRDYVARRPGYEVREGRVVIAQAIVLEPIFPGLRFGDLL